MCRAPSCNCSTSAPAGPVVDACVVVKWLDENRMLLDPQGDIDPSILRLEGLVGHFSTYSFVAVGLAGDYNLDGIVDAADYVVWRKGGSGGCNTCDNSAKHWQRLPCHWLCQCLHPEPTSQLTLILGMLAIFFRRRAVVS